MQVSRYLGIDLTNEGAYTSSMDASTDAVFRALADPTRRAVVARLAQGDASTTVLAATAAMAMPSLLQHLRVLEDCGLLQSTKEGRVRTYSLNGEALAPTLSWLQTQKQLWEQRLDQLDAYLLQLKDPS